MKEFRVGDRVVLVSNTAEDPMLEEDERGTVIEVNTVQVNPGLTITDIRVAWDSGYECSLDPEECDEE